MFASKKTTALMVTCALFGAMTSLGANATILANAPIGIETLLEVVPQDLNIQLNSEINEQLIVCFGTSGGLIQNGTCSESPYYNELLISVQAKDLNELETEVYGTPQANTVSYTPSSEASANDTYRVNFEYCLINEESNGGCSSPPLSDNVLFTIIQSTQIRTAADVFEDDIICANTELQERDLEQPSLSDFTDATIEVGKTLANRVPTASDCNEYNNLSQKDKDTILASINPEEVVAQYTIIKQLLTSQTSNIFKRINELRRGSEGASIAGLTYSSHGQQFSGEWLHAIADSVGGSAGADSAPSKWGFFVNGSLTDGERDGTALERGYDNDANTLTLGADYRFSRNMVAGIAYGISESSLDFDGNKDGMDNDTNNVIVYGSWYKEAFNVDLLVGTSQGDIETKRVITYINTTTTGTDTATAKGDTDTQQTFFSIAGGYDFNNGALTFGPYASVDYITGEIDDYSEIGDSGLEVGFEEQDIDSQVFTMGGRVSYAVSTHWGVIVPYARAEWKKEFDDSRDIISGRFVDQSGSSTFSILADDFDDNWFHAAVGVSATFRHGISAYIDYDSIIAYDDTSLTTLSYGGRWKASF